MKRRGLPLLSMLTLLILAACAPSAPQTRSARDGRPPAAPGQPERTLVIATRVEPPSLVGKLLAPSGISPNAPGQLFHTALAVLDERLVPRPSLVEALPQLNTDTWRVLPDGKMETVYRLKPNLTWHDGTSLTADDFVFAWQVYRVPEFEGARRPLGLMEEVVALDPRTVLIRWHTSYGEAGAITGTRSGMPPLPRHILEATFQQGQSQLFASHPYWTQEFVGLGPYRLERWEPGAFIDGAAFSGYVHGPPRIGRVKIVWISDANTAVAGLLSGAVHYTTDEAIAFEQAVVLKQDWVQRNAGTLLLSPSKARLVQVQFKTEYTRPAAILDLRVRRALAHAIDKQALVDALLDGEPGMADTLIAPQEEYFPELDRVLTKYPYDLARAQQLMAEAGFTRDAEGFYIQSGTRFSAELWATSGDSGEREAVILADGWKGAGIQTPVSIIPAARAQDLELLSTYPAFRIDQSGVVGENPLGKFTAQSIAAPANRWNGSNRGGFFDPEFQRLYDLFGTTLDRVERNRAGIQAMKIAGELLPVFPLYYSYQVVAHDAALRGPRTGAQGEALWNVSEWEWR